ncbi:MAG: AAA family ATPase [Alphaproteobacteria bacterium]|nr:AAA family ATPase [Alphaproteobacteria bacterium]
MMEASITLQTVAQEASDQDRGIARLDPSDLRRLGLSVGARLAIKGGRTIYVTAHPAMMDYRNQGMILLDEMQLHNCGCKIGDQLKIIPAPSLEPLATLTLATQHVLDTRAAKARLNILRSQLEGQTLSVGDIVRLRMADQYDLIAQVTATDGGAPGIVRPMTALSVMTAPSARSVPAVANVGGLRREFFWLEEWLQSIQRQPLNSQRGLVLEGPAGSGKSILIEALAQYTGTYLDKINAARVIADDNSAASLFEQSFATAASQSPAIIVIDDIDMLLPQTDNWAQKIIANQFYAQLDALPRQVPVAVIGIAHQQNALDPAALRPGRFERRLVIEAPDHANRLEILEIVTREYPLANDVQLERLAALTHGFVGTDLTAMVRQAQLRAERSGRLKARATGAALPKTQQIAMHHFRAALTEIVPHGLSGYHSESATVSWQDIAGLEDIKQTLREAVERPINFGLLHDNNGAPPPHGVLVTGASGTGKTSIVRALASATRARFIHVDARHVALAATPAETLRQIFIKARQSAPAMLFFDNIEAITPNSFTPDDKNAVVFNAFLREFDATQDLIGLTILAATSHADRIDHSLLRPGRFDYVINIPLPDSVTRRKIFDYHAHKLPLAADVNCDELAEVTHGFSGADIEGVCRRAGLLALRQSVAQQDGQLAPPVVNMAIFMQILRGWRR